MTQQDISVCRSYTISYQILKRQALSSSSLFHLYFSLSHTHISCWTFINVKSNSQCNQQGLLFLHNTQTHTSIIEACKTTTIHTCYRSSKNIIQCTNTNVQSSWNLSQILYKHSNKTFSRKRLNINQLQIPCKSLYQGHNDHISMDKHLIPREKHVNKNNKTI